MYKGIEMAEIKSTMDLVMERTRNMSMTEDEKKEKKREDAAARIQGFVRKLIDGTIRQADADREFNAIKDTFGDGDSARIERMLRRTLLDHLGFDRENTMLLRLLESRFDIDSEPFHQIFEEYGKTLDTARQERLNRLKQEMAVTPGISGSAIIPNPAADAGWGTMLTDIRDQYGRRLEEEKSKAAGRT